MGNLGDLVWEDLAFASSLIVTRDVASFEFDYAKITTLPLFDSAVAGSPPEGFIHAKNSREMQMCFFIYEGKVMVEVGAQGAQGEVNQFAVRKGGVWEGAASRHVRTAISDLRSASGPASASSTA